MQALHAFCLADVTLCMPPNDPASFVRCLGPYLKVPPADPAASEKEVRRGAERLLCILFIISSLLCKLDRLAPEAAQDLESDLVQLITLHRFQSVRTSVSRAYSIRTGCRLHMLKDFFLFVIYLIFNICCYICFTSTGAWQCQHIM